MAALSTNWTAALHLVHAAFASLSGFALLGTQSGYRPPNYLPIALWIIGVCIVIFIAWAFQSQSAALNFKWRIQWSLESMLWSIIVFSWFCAVAKWSNYIQALQCAGGGVCATAIALLFCTVRNWGLWFVFVSVSCIGFGLFPETAREWERMLDPSSLSGYPSYSKDFANLERLTELLCEFDPSSHRFPASYSGTPPVSWRVRILPSLGYMDLYKRYRLNEPWNSPANLALKDEMPREFCAFDNPRDAHGITSYLGLALDGSIWEGPHNPSYQAKKGYLRPLVLATAPEMEVSWLEPRDLGPDDLPIAFNTDYVSPNGNCVKFRPAIFAEFLEKNSRCLIETGCDVQRLTAFSSASNPFRHNLIRVPEVIDFSQVLWAGSALSLWSLVRLVIQRVASSGVAG